MSVPVTNGNYAIISLQTKTTAVDLLDGGSAAGTPINGWATAYTPDNTPQPWTPAQTSGGGHQVWQITDKGNGQVQISNAVNGSVITANTGLSKPVTGQPPPQNVPEGLWTLEAKATDTSNSYVIHNVKYTTGVLDLSYGSATSGTPILCWPEANPPTANQIWILKKI